MVVDHGISLHFATFRRLVPFSALMPEPCAARMNRAQRGAARVAPVPGKLVLLSRPTQTTQVKFGVYPANHASR